MYMTRSGISDSELARHIGVRRQTIFRWKEGLVERPRAREDVLRCATKLRLSDEERDLLLVAAGFAPELAVPDPPAESLADATPIPAGLPAPESLATENVTEEIDLVPSGAEAEPSALALPAPEPVDEINADPLPAVPVDPAQIDNRLRWLPWGMGVLVLLMVVWVVWFRNGFGVDPVTLTPLPPVVTPTLVYPVAQTGETLLLIAQFTGYTTNERYNVAGRISEELASQIAEAKLLSTTVQIWPEEIPSAMRAGQLLAATNATMLIWGEYDSGRVRVNLETRDATARQKRDFTLTSADDLVTTINSTVPNEIRLVALMALGRLLRDQAKYADAAAAFQRALELDPEDDAIKALLNFYLGYLAEQSTNLSDLNRAVAYYTRAIEFDDQLYVAYYNRGSVQIQRFDLQPADDLLLTETISGAISDLTHVIKHRATYLDAYLNRAIAYYSRDEPTDLAAALQDLDRLLALQHGMVDVYYVRGLVHIRAGAQTEWVADFQQTLALQPTHVGAISGLCWGYALAQQAETALSYCDQAVELDTTGASRDSRAIAYAQLGRYADAITDFRAYLDWLKTQQPTTLYVRHRGPRVEAWITRLTAGENPFDAALLELLRHRERYTAE